MIYLWLADLIVVLHLLFILFALFGALLVLWRRWMLWLHLPAALWAMMVEFNSWICPLTPLENYLKGLGGNVGYGNSFIEHYLTPIIYPAGLTQNIQILLGCIVLLVNIGIYTVVFRQWSRRD